MARERHPAVGTRSAPGRASHPERAATKPPEAGGERGHGGVRLGRRFGSILGPDRAFLTHHENQRAARYRASLTARAHALGTTPEILAVDSPRKHFSSESDLDEEPAGTSKAKTLADLLDGYIGVLHSSEYVPGGAQLSEDTGKKFAEGLARKRTAGRARAPSLRTVRNHRS